MGNTRTENSLEKIKSRASIGGCGVVLIDGDTAQNEITGPFAAITVIGTAPAVIDTSECTTNIASETATISIPNGVTIFGDFTSLQFDTAAGVIAYYRCD